MKRRHLKRISILLVFGVVVIMLLPCITAYYSTPNPPQAGSRVPPNPNDVDVSATIHQIDAGIPNLILGAHTGGPIWNPDQIGLPPGGEDWVWVIDFDIHAEYDDPPAHVTKVEARVEAELWLVAVPPVWKCTEGQGVEADAVNTDEQMAGGLYLYDSNPQYQQGDVYHLYIWAQARYYDDVLDQWNTTDTDSLDLYYIL